jgi:hypothetical protein
MEKIGCNADPDCPGLKQLLELTIGNDFPALLPDNQK